MKIAKHTLFALSLTLTSFQSASLAEAERPAKEEKYQVLQTCYQDYWQQLQQKEALRENEFYALLNYYADPQLGQDSDYHLLLNWIQTLPPKDQKNAYALFNALKHAPGFTRGV